MLSSATTVSTCAPAIVLMVLHPTQAMQLSSATSLAPYQPQEKRVEVIWRRPSLGPNTAMKAGRHAVRTLAKRTTSIESPRPRPKRRGPRMPMPKVDRTGKGNLA